MRANLGSKAGLALVAAVALSLCVPAYAAPGNRGGHGYSQGRGTPPAQRHHHQHRSSGNGVGLVLGIAAIGAAIVASRAYSQPAPAYYAPAQTIYVEPPPPVVQPMPQPSWYYCRELNTYYPYVQQCPGPWLQVAPSQPGPPPGG